LPNASALSIKSISLNGCLFDRLHLANDVEYLDIEVIGSLLKPIFLDLAVYFTDIYGQKLGYYCLGYLSGQTALYPEGPFNLQRRIKLPRMTKGDYYLSLKFIHPGIVTHVMIENAVKISTEGVVGNSGRQFSYHDIGWIVLNEM
jgi:hypothetical protein